MYVWGFWHFRLLLFPHTETLWRNWNYLLWGESGWSWFQLGDEGCLLGGFLEGGSGLGVCIVGFFYPICCRAGVLGLPPKCHSFSFPSPPQSRGLYPLNNCTTELILLTKDFRAVVTCHLFSYPTTNWQLTGMWITVKTLKRYVKDWK